MENIMLLADSLKLIEDTLGENLSTDEIASRCACSRSTLEKLFRYVYHRPVHEYVVMRRMMRAARLMKAYPEMNLLEVAMECGYSSNEAFTRAFKGVWQVNPSVFRKGSHAELFPRFAPPTIKGDEYIMSRMNFDISELYDLFCERKNCYFVVCDIKSLIPINEISRKAGDLAIVTAMQRMSDAAGPNDLVFRIGGDEFCMLTASEDVNYADGIVDAILKHNGEPIVFEGREIPLMLYAGTVKLDLKHMKYDVLFTGLHNALKDVKVDREVK
ncbi:MAG: helix-turn-helix domain-containing protein [Lachnospiraceae bacterium]|nr:helix-turn-helix domain-containing protein [Lachnospiraceae bacterium]